MNNKKKALKKEVWITQTPSIWDWLAVVLCDGEVQWLIAIQPRELPVIQF